MPVIKCPNGKYRIGSGPCVYTSKGAAERAYAAYRAKEHSQKEETNMPYPNEHALRLRDPGDFDDKSFRRTHGSGAGMVHGVKIPASIDVIWGKLKGSAGADDPPIAQALRFKVSKWGRDPEKAKAWIKDNEMKGSFDAADAKAEENSAASYDGDSKPFGVDNNDLHVFIVQGSDKTYRYEVWQGRQQLVVPVIGLVEGVHNGIFYPGEEIANYIEAWNGVPVPVYHPKDMENGVPVSCNDPMIVEQQCVGRLWNVGFDASGAKMRGEVWIDVEKAKELNSTIITTILNGGKMEVSTGLWGDHIHSPGEWNGEPFEYVLRNYRPDHLALLPGEIGACSWEDGCGIRINHVANKEEVQMPHDDKGKGTAREPLRGADAVVMALAKQMKLLAPAEVSHEEIRWTLQEELGKLLKPALSQPSLAEAWVREVYDNYFIYEAVADGGNRLFKQPYKVKGEEVTLDGSPVEVALKQDYVELGAAKQQGGDTAPGNTGADADRQAPENTTTNAQEEQRIMDKKQELVNFLIQNGKLGWAETDRDALMALDEAVLDKMKTSYEALQKEPEPKKEPEPAPDKKEEPVVNAEPEVKKEPEQKAEPEPKPKTPDEFIANAPDEMKEVLSEGLKMHRAKKDTLVKALLANKRNKFTEEQLRAKKTEELEALVELAAVEVDYSGNRALQHREPKINERKEDGTGVPDMPTPAWTADGKPDFSAIR